MKGMSSGGNCCGCAMCDRHRATVSDGDWNIIQKGLGRLKITRTGRHVGGSTGV
jgi:hypothetical protein